ncbi:hypothetical protein DV451_000587 [Geotrichum candidum]|uniref:Uncharacterized protein n=1 Tax=Geotrichum candidum TaxID=1173061 RepID=A0A9P5KWG8_GEOCN|nr:hypothetical protein DV451_000587 [Geotrichum candidum]KAI9215107.1 hypothetical protein DS838_000093 [Geotrichum bryndzae]KAF5108835.1 hypothetical protein DV453_002004 [Geotrichum candidum]KAF5117702.1 hypothetical protein DV454_000998 [Geotrichum candidum]KAF5119588.1 hypothetical protein DV452_001598 [Geotrichum candidum]
MGLFSSSTTPESTPDLTKKSARKVCWESRDKYFACLDKHNILDPRKDPATALAKCSSEDAEFNRDCEKRVVEYKKEQQIKALEAQGARRLDSSIKIE